MTDPELIGMNKLYAFYKKHTVKLKKNATKEERLKVQFRYLVDRPTFVRVVKDFNKEVARMIIEDAIEFRMPSNLGKVRMIKYKDIIRLNEDGSLNLKKKPIDWKASYKLWEREYPGLSRKELYAIKKKPLVYHLNDHTNGYRFRLQWVKHGSAIINRGVYRIFFTKANRHMIAEAVRKNPNIAYYDNQYKPL